MCVTELPANQAQIWQGAYIATFDLNGITTKIEISHYGGLGKVGLVKDFAHAISHFEDKLGLTFLQLSENFTPED